MDRFVAVDRFVTLVRFVRAVAVFFWTIPVAVASLYRSRV
jgi:hypothetical protein